MVLTTVLLGIGLQAPSARAQAAATGGDPYVGNWTLHMVGQMQGRFDVDLKVTNEGGKLVGELLSGALGTSRSTGSTLNNRALTMQFSFETPNFGTMNGTLLLEPDGAKYKATATFTAVGFEIPGEAVKR